MKKAFSLLEVILVIVIIGIIASFAIPKYMNTRDSALASTIKRDVITTITSLQSHYLINRKIDKISDVLVLNDINWELKDKKMIFKENEETCIDLEIKNSKIVVIVFPQNGRVCNVLDELGVRSQDIDLI